jgi:hypothetical protein
MANPCAKGVTIFLYFETKKEKHNTMFLFFNDLLQILINKPHRWFVLIPYARNLHCPTSFHINLYSSLSPTRQSGNGKRKSSHICNLSTRWRWVARSMLQPLWTLGKKIGIDFLEVWAPEPLGVWWKGKYLTLQWIESWPSSRWTNGFLNYTASTVLTSRKLYQMVPILLEVNEVGIICIANC